MEFRGDPQQMPLWAERQAMAVRKGREGRGLAQLGQLLKPLHLGGRVGAVVEAGAGPCWAGLPPVGDAQSGSQAVPKAPRCVCGVCLCAKARRKDLFPVTWLGIHLPASHLGTRYKGRLWALTEIP